MHGLSDLREGSYRRLPPVRDRDAADRPTVQVGRIVAGEILHVVQRVLDHAADPTVVARAGDEDAVGSTDGIDERLRSRVTFVGLDVVDGQQ